MKALRWARHYKMLVALIATVAAIALAAGLSDQSEEPSDPSTTSVPPVLCTTPEAPRYFSPCVPQPSLKPVTTSTPTGHGPGSAQPGSADVYQIIASLTSCSALQERFDTAFENHQRDIKRGATGLAEVDTGYMNAADKRMKALGCY